MLSPWFGMTGTGPGQQLLVKLRGFEPLTFSSGQAVGISRISRPSSVRLAESSTLQRISSSDGIKPGALQFRSRVRLSHGRVGSSCV